MFRNLVFPFRIYRAFTFNLAVRINSNYFPKHKYLFRLCNDIQCLHGGMNVFKFRPLKGWFRLSTQHITYTRHLDDDHSAESDINTSTWAAHEGFCYHLTTLAYLFFAPTHSRQHENPSTLHTVSVRTYTYTTYHCKSQNMQQTTKILHTTWTVTTAHTNLYVFNLQRNNRTMAG
jgi:hypothetical protein